MRIVSAPTILSLVFHIPSTNAISSSNYHMINKIFHKAIILFFVIYVCVCARISPIPQVVAEGVVSEIWGYQFCNKLPITSIRIWTAKKVCCYGMFPSTLWIIKKFKVAPSHIIKKSIKQDKTIQQKHFMRTVPRK